MEEVSSSNQQESQWIDLARAGDLSAFNQLVLTYQDVAFRTAKWMVTDEASAEDIVQNVFLSAYCRLATFRRNCFRAWLLRMVRNACIDELRRRKRHPYLTLESEDPDVETVGRDQWPLRPQETPEEILIHSEDWECIEQILHELPGPMREVIILVDMENLNYLEAAVILKVPLGTIKSRLGRARASVRHMLNQRYQGVSSASYIIIPLFERRIAASPFAGLTQTVAYNKRVGG